MFNMSPALTILAIEQDKSVKQTLSRVFQGHKVKVTADVISNCLTQGICIRTSVIDEKLQNKVKEHSMTYRLTDERDRQA